MLNFIWNQLLKILKFMKDLFFKPVSKEIKEDIEDVEIQNHANNTNNSSVQVQRVVINEDFFNDNQRKKACYFINHIFSTKQIDLVQRYPNYSCPIEILKTAIKDNVINSIDLICTAHFYDADCMRANFTLVNQGLGLIRQSQQIVGQKLDNIDDCLNKNSESLNKMSVSISQIEQMNFQMLGMIQQLMEKRNNQETQRSNSWVGM
jgi:hypothetical protein